MIFQNAFSMIMNSYLQIICKIIIIFTNFEVFIYFFSCAWFQAFKLVYHTGIECYLVKDYYLEVVNGFNCNHVCFAEPCRVCVCFNLLYFYHLLLPFWYYEILWNCLFNNVSNYNCVNYLLFFYVFIGSSDDVIEQIVCKENDIANNG